MKKNDLLKKYNLKPSQNISKKFDVIVIGAGHAGVEAANIASVMGLNTCLITLNIDNIAQMSCNPAIGGLAKGHLVMEVSYLGGLMGEAIDKTGIQFKILNKRKGPAVWSHRAQADKNEYRKFMINKLFGLKNLTIIQSEALKIVTDKNSIKGIITKEEVYYETKTLILTTGTFLKGLIHIGLVNFKAGRLGDFAATELSGSLIKNGLKLGRLKTGTPPRIKAETIDFSKMEVQKGDRPLPFFLNDTKKASQPQLPCYVAYTNDKTIKEVKKGLHKSPLYTGKIKSIGPRYCPSIEDKIVKFPHHKKHRIFIEPETKEFTEAYLNGLSTSLPYETQLAYVRTVGGLERAEIVRPGYGIEYDFVYPYQLKYTLETKKINGLFLAGQINGTSGYEEAAAQGIIAGINASSKILKKEPLILSRKEAYTGVLVDDLLNKEIKEPYRMFTSRAEFRLLLREDNTDERLFKYALKYRLMSPEKLDSIKKELTNRKSCKDKFKKTFIYDKKILKKINKKQTKITLNEMIRQSSLDVNYLLKTAAKILEITEKEVKTPLIDVKYEGYIKKNNAIYNKIQKNENKKIPKSFDYKKTPGLSLEASAKLQQIKPQNLGQAMRISGVTPADIQIILFKLFSMEK